MMEKGGDMMSFTEGVLQTRQAKEAIIEGLITWFSTGSFQKGWDIMIVRGNQNFAYPAFKIAIVLDFLKGLFDDSKK